jgi:hypothetical protein
MYALRLRLSYLDLPRRREVRNSMVTAGGVMQRQQHGDVVIRVKNVVQRSLRDMTNLLTLLETARQIGVEQTYPTIATRCQRTPCSCDDVVDSIVRVTAP